MQKYSGLAMDTAGNVLAQALITVNTAGTTALASIFSDDSFTPIANPFTADADGTAVFYGHGRFDVVVTKGGFEFRTTQTSDIFLYDPMSTLSFTVTGNQDNWAPVNGAHVSTWRLTGTAPFTVTGIAAGFAGQRLTLINVAAATITLANSSLSSTAANQILTGGGDFTITTDQTVNLQYDTITARWRVVGMTAATLTTIVTGTNALYGSRNLLGANNAGAPTTRYDLSADVVLARNASDGTTVTLTAPTVTLDVTTAGPIANGRDQAGSFTTPSWLHLYWIGKADGTKAAIASATPPPTGPTLPAMYTHWAYIGALRFNAAAQIVVTHLRGQWSHYVDNQVIVAAGLHTTETAVSYAALVPPNAHSYFLSGAATIYPANNVSPRVRLVSGVEWLDNTAYTDQGYAKVVIASIVPNMTGQQIYYFQTPTSQGGIWLSVRGYCVSNGAS